MSGQPYYFPQQRNDQQANNSEAAQLYNAANSYQCISNGVCNLSQRYASSAHQASYGTAPALNYSNLARDNDLCGITHAFFNNIQSDQLRLSGPGQNANFAYNGGTNNTHNPNGYGIPFQGGMHEPQHFLHFLRPY
jgi:hypothetical protein